jgi:hypothetical protein
MSAPNPKCSACQCYFVPTLKSSGLPYKTCEKCRKHDKKWRDTHKEHIKEYNEIYNEENQEAIKEKKNEYYQANKELIAEKAKIYRQKNKERIESKAAEKIPCECGMLIRRDWFSRHQTTLQHLDTMEHK